MYKIFLEKYENLPVQIKASFWFLICAFLEKGITIITTPIYTRLFNTAEYGEYSVFTSWLGIMTIFISLNLFSGVFSQGLVKFEEKRKVFCSSLQGLSFTLLICWLIIYLLFSEIINNIFQLTTIQVTAMFLTIWTSSVFSFWAMSERVRFKYQKLIILTISVAVLKPLLCIFLIFNFEDKVTARILGVLVVNFFAYVGLFIKQIYEGKKFYDKKFWKYAVMFNLPLIPHYLSGSILSSGDRIMIAKMAGVKEAGIYSLAYSVSMVMTIFNTALFQTIEPWLYIKIKEKNFNRMSQIIYPLIIMMGFLNILFIAFAPEIIRIFAPKEYFEAIWIIPPVAMSVYFMFLYTFFAVFEFYYEKTKYIAFATFGGAFLNIILNYICIDIWGYIAAGYTTLVCYICYVLLHFYFMKKICKEYLRNVNVYDIKKIFLISCLFISTGFLFLFSYMYILIRYSLISIIVLIIIFNYKKIKSLSKKLIEIKKSK